MRRWLAQHGQPRRIPLLSKEKTEKGGRGWQATQIQLTQAVVGVTPSDLSAIFPDAGEPSKNPGAFIP